MENEYDISREREFDRRYWCLEVFKINGRIEIARTLNEKKKNTKRIY